MDADGKPGVTATYSNTDGFQHPRTSAAAFGFNRADNAYTASRVVLSLAGSLTDCNNASGIATVPRLDTRIFGASRSGGDQDCSRAEGDFLDRGSLNYVLGAATYSLLRVADGAACPQIRAAIP